MADECSQGVLDLSKKCLKKVPKQEDAQNVKCLILDDNELQKIDNIDSYLRIEKLSLSKNQLLRMYGVCRLHYLKDLNLSYNGILTIEGIKELVHLKYLNLEGNNIKVIEHLNANTKLEVINLSENSIGSISDVSYLKSLKELNLNGNRITHLRQCDKYLPTSLETLILAKNNITDLNEICTLSHLCNLNSISIADNPCVQMTGNVVGFDYRPFVLNWCMSVKIIDGYVVYPMESLKAEWLYSQGRGRQFRIGEQVALAKYLSSNCILNDQALENENERKLRLILSKAQQHQRQLQEEISESSNSGSNSPSSSRRKGPPSRIQSPRFSRLGGRQGSPDSMSNSYHGNTSVNLDTSVSSNTNQLIQMTTSLIENIKSDNIMTQSLDPTCLLNNSKNLNISNTQQEPQLKQFTEQPLQQMPVMGGPLTAASKMVPVPESLMSPDCCPTQTNTMSNKIVCNASVSSPLVTKPMQKTKDNSKVNSKMSRSPNLKRSERSSPVLSPRKVNTTGRINCNNNNNKSNTHVQITPPDSSCNNTIVSSDDDSDHINVDKLKTIRNKAAQKCQQNKDNIMNNDQSILNNHIINKSTENSAILIQKIWRGYFTRKKTKYISEKLQKQRTQEYIEKLKEDMEMTKSALENERKIQHLQMQAINALWKKVSTMQQPVAIPTGTVMLDGTQSGLDINGAGVIQDLAKTCSILNNQVQQLQGSMRDIVNCMTMMCNLPNNTINNTHDKDSSSTQTEIIAVHTPQQQQPPSNENNLPFPFAGLGGKITRPSTLSLDSNETSPKSNNSTNTTTACTDLILDIIDDDASTPIDSNKIDENQINIDESMIIENNNTIKTSDEGLIINNEKIAI